MDPTVCDACYEYLNRKGRLQLALLTTRCLVFPSLQTQIANEMHLHFNTRFETILFTQSVPVPNRRSIVICSSVWLICVELRAGFLPESVLCNVRFCTDDANIV